MHPFFAFLNSDRPIIPEYKKWPKEWTTIFFKLYPRLKYFPLSRPHLDPIMLEEAIISRKSGREFSGEAISSDTLSALLLYSCGILRGGEDQSRRAQPSGGARYPIELYPIIFRAKNIPEGVYHYNVKDHALELLTEDRDDLKEVRAAFSGVPMDRVAVMMAFTMVPHRSSMKYGNLAFKLGLLEAGHISQNMYLLSHPLGLQCCALGGCNGALVHRVLDIDGVTEVTFYAIAVGMK